jgi:uncharacterized MAPEG superfamily protein
MNFAYWCVLAAALLPYATVAIAKRQRGYDNRSPREWAARLEGRAKRAVAAHQNHFEAFPAFAAGVIIAQICAAPQHSIDVIAGTFIALRVAYTAAYLADRHLLRSLIWMGGLACTIALFAIAALTR